MQKLEVFGANKLKGQIKISGSKNASLPILAATLLSNKKIILRNLPKVQDIKTMRAGILVLGPLLAKFGKARVSSPGGCSIGVRPIDLHLEALSKLGVKYKIHQGYVYATAPKGLIGSKIRFSKISSLIIELLFALHNKTIICACKSVGNPG